MALHFAWAAGTALACWSGVLAWRHRRDIDNALIFLGVVVMVLFAFFMNLVDTVAR